MIPLPAMYWNSALSTNRRGKRFTIPWVKVFKELIPKFMEHHDLALGGKPEYSTSKFYRLDIYVFLATRSFWINDLSRPRKSDASGFTKIIEDAVVKYTGVDDSYNLDVFTSKRPTPYPEIDAPFFIIYLGETTVDAQPILNRIIQLPEGTIEIGRLIRDPSFWNI